MAEVLYDMISDITDVPGDFKNVVLTDGSTQKTAFYKRGVRALELFDSSVESYFLKTFGRNEREIVCDCERSNTPSMVQVLHLANGDTLNGRLRDKDSPLVASLSADGVAVEKIIEEVYMRCFSREATTEEKVALQEVFAEAPVEERRAAIEDLLWALMTSREFLFQH